MDTSKATEFEESRFYNHPKHVRFLEEWFPDRKGRPDAPRWLFPFMHHPPLCAGPHHRNTTSLHERLLPLAQRAGVRLVLSGHEHNFQHSELDGIHFVITGAAGKLRTDRPQHFEDARTVGWSAEAHFLLVEVDGGQSLLTPVGGHDGDGLQPIPVATPAGEPVPMPIVVDGPGGGGGGG